MSSPVTSDDDACDDVSASKQTTSVWEELEEPSVADPSSGSAADRGSGTADQDDEERSDYLTDLTISGSLEEHEREALALERSTGLAQSTSGETFEYVDSDTVSGSSTPRYPQDLEMTLRIRDDEVGSPISRSAEPGDDYTSDNNAYAAEKGVLSATNLELSVTYLELKIQKTEVEVVSPTFRSADPGDDYTADKDDAERSLSESANPESATEDQKVREDGCSEDFQLEVDLEKQENLAQVIAAVDSKDAGENSYPLNDLEIETGELEVLNRVKSEDGQTEKLSPEDSVSSSGYQTAADAPLEEKRDNRNTKSIFVMIENSVEKRDSRRLEDSSSRRYFEEAIRDADLGDLQGELCGDKQVEKSPKVGLDPKVNESAYFLSNSHDLIEEAGTLHEGQLQVAPHLGGSCKEELYGDKMVEKSQTGGAASEHDWISGDRQDLIQQERTKLEEEFGSVDLSVAISTTSCLPVGLLTNSEPASSQMELVPVTAGLTTWSADAEKSNLLCALDSRRRTEVDNSNWQLARHIEDKMARINDADLDDLENVQVSVKVRQLR